MVKKWYISWLLQGDHNFFLQAYTTHNNSMEHSCPKAATKQRQFIALAGDGWSPHLCTQRKDWEERLQALEILCWSVLKPGKMQMVLLRGVGLDMSFRCLNWDPSGKPEFDPRNSYKSWRRRTRQTNVPSNLNIYTVASAPHIPHTHNILIFN